ncbi:MAG: hypothetical protein AAFN74_03315, partial [Myxococcota bacterium]
LLPLTACASIFSGSSQDVQVNVRPLDADVFVDGQQVLPGVVELKRSGHHSIEVTKDGYVPQTMKLERGVNGVTWVNLLFWPGFIVDLITGAFHDINPERVQVVLAKEGTEAVASDDPVAVAEPEAAEPTSTRVRASVPSTRASEAQQKWVVAVMTVEHNQQTELDPKILLGLTDQLRVYLGERGIRVVDRGTQEEAMKSVIGDEKKRSYSDCVDSSCQIPLGKALAATHILRSTIARFGKTCSSNAELIDLRAEVTVAAKSQRGECSPEALLDASEVIVEGLIRDAR